MIKKFIFLVFGGVFLFFSFNSCTTTKLSQQSSFTVSDLIDNGNFLAQNGKFYEAFSEYKRALSIDNSSLIAKRNMGIVLVKLGRYQEGVNYFYDVRSFYESDPEFLYFFGEGLRGTKSYRQSLDFYIKARELDPEDSRILKSMSWVYLKIENTQEAEKIITPYFKRHKNDLQAMLIMSHVLNKKKKYSQSVKILKNFEDSRFSIIGRNKSLVETEKILLLESLGNAYEGLNNCTKALKIYSVVLQLRPFLVSSLNASARCNLVINQKPAALTKLEKALTSEPNNPETLYLLGNVYLGSDSKRAKFYYGRFLEEVQKESLAYSSEILKVTERVNQLNVSSSQSGSQFN